MMNLWHKLWRDQRGSVGAMGVILTCVILGLGAIMGLVVMRNAIVQECGDLAVALRHLDQSFSFTAGTTTHQYIDTETSVLPDPAGQLPADMTFVPLTSSNVPGEQ